MTKARGGVPEQGIGAVGVATIVSDPQFPEHEFFQAGRLLAVRLRHGNYKEFDDASIDVRTASLKFADDDSKSPLDLTFHTGEEALFWNMESFEKTVKAFRAGPEASKEYILADPWRLVDSC